MVAASTRSGVVRGLVHVFLPFAAVILPVIFLLGLLTTIRLVDITLENQTLTISAERRSQQDGSDEGKGGGEHLLRERRYTRFLRSFTLPPTVNEQTVNAKLADGVLTALNGPGRFEPLG